MDTRIQSQKYPNFKNRSRYIFLEYPYQMRTRYGIHSKAMVSGYPRWIDYSIVRGSPFCLDNHACSLLITTIVIKGEHSSFLFSFYSVSFSRQYCSLWPVVNAN
jgi:hypothetical protein